MDGLTGSGLRRSCLVLALCLIPPGVAPAQGLPDCQDGVVKDDGSVETGYGWVPSAIEGIYVQEFHSDELPDRRLGRACICWLRTRPDDELDFDVVVYEDVGGIPAMTPVASVPAHASEVPEGVVAAGRFYEVDLTGVVVPEGTFYLGARWNPSQDQYFFICADRSPGTEPVGGFFIDDRADEWGDVLDTVDPMFTGHRAMMIRVAARPRLAPAVPTVTGFGATALVALVALGGALLLQRRHQR